MRDAAAANDIPILPHRLTPDVSETFWVNLIGRGYPAPRNKFRWCTHRLKIKPSNSFIRNVVRENGEAILVLGTRRAESQARARSIEKHAGKAIRDRLTPNAGLLNSLVYTPIEYWTNDDVWAFLTQVKNPWGHNNHDLMTMYRGASADGECPLVVDTSTPSCGNSRFGCYICTLVDQDKSMGAMIQNDREKEWMEPLLALRNELDFRGDEKRAIERKNRDFRRLTGDVTFYTDAADKGQLIPGPYTQEARAHWLRRLLETQRDIQELAPKDIRDWVLITLPELQEIRRLWVIDKHEIEDVLPGIYTEVLKVPYPGSPIDDDLVFDKQALSLLKELCGADAMHFELMRNLLDVERRYRTKPARRGLFTELEKTVKRCFYEGAEDALNRARQRFQAANPDPDDSESNSDLVALTVRGQRVTADDRMAE